jgi:hypothetical protein
MERDEEYPLPSKQSTGEEMQDGKFLVLHHREHHGSYNHSLFFFFFG